MTEIAEGNIGSAGKYDLKFEAGKLVVEIDAGVGASSAGLILKIDGKQVLDALKNAIPGEIDNAVIDVIEAAVLGK